MAMSRRGALSRAPEQSPSSSQASGKQQEQDPHLSVGIGPEQLGAGLVHSQPIGPS